MIVKDSVCKEAHEADIDRKDEDSFITGPSPLEATGEKKYIPAQNVEAIYAFGSVNYNTSFLSLCSYHAIPVHSFGYYGNYLGSYMPKAEINSGSIVIRQCEHYSDQTKRFRLCCKLIEGAGDNILSNLKYYSYRGVSLEEEIFKIESVLSDLKNYSDESDISLEPDEIAFHRNPGLVLGYEGNMRQIYYSAWKKFLKQDTGFSKRTKRPPDDLINCLISFGNTMLYTICLNEIYRTGLLPSIGFLHTPGDNRFPLSFDLSEIFKPVIVDKVIFRLVNLEMIKENDIKQNNNGQLVMKEGAKRKFVEEMESRLKTVINHPVLKRGVSYRTLIRLECHNIIKHLKGLAIYKPYKAEA